MADQLVVRLPDEDGAPARWIVVDHLGTPAGPPREGPLAELAAAAKVPVVALVPAHEVLRTTVNVPVRNQARLLQALPYALEDQVAEDVDRLHFAAGARNEGGVEAAIMNRERLQHRLDVLAEAGIRPRGLYSEADALGHIPGNNTLLFGDGRLVLRDAGGGITTGDAGALDAILELWLDTQRGEDETVIPPVHLLVYVTSPADRHFNDTMEALRPRIASLDIKILRDHGIARLASHIITSPGVNLLQGPLAPPSSFGLRWREWRVAAVLLLAVAVAMLGARMLEVSQLRRQAAEMEATVAEALRYTFPGVGDVRDARRQFESQLSALGEQGQPGGGGQFLAVLNAVAAALGETDGARLESVSYRSGTMDLRVRAPSVEVLDRIRESVTGAGLRAEIQSANADGDQVQGRLRVSMAGA